MQVPFVLLGECTGDGEGGQREELDPEGEGLGTVFGGLEGVPVEVDLVQEYLECELCFGHIVLILFN